MVGLDVGTDPRRLREIMAANELERVALVQGDITLAEDLGRVLDDHEITSVIHLAALQIPFCRENPRARRGGERPRHRERLRGGEAAPRADRRPACLCELRRLLRPRRRRPRARARGRPLAAHHALRRLQAGERGKRADLLAGRGRLVARPEALHRLRPGPRPGRHGRAHARDQSGRSGRRIPHRRSEDA